MGFLPSRGAIVDSITCTTHHMEPQYKRIEAYVITPESTIRHVFPENGLYFSPEELVRLVSGHIRIIKLDGIYEGKVLVVAANAEGKELHLKYNTVATTLAKSKVYGNALVCEKHLIK